MPDGAQSPTRVTAIALVNWNGGADTVECLGSIDRLEIRTTRLAVLIVDNASSDDSRARIHRQLTDMGYGAAGENLSGQERTRVDREAWYRSDSRAASRVCVVHARENYGFAAANNIATAIARAVVHPEFVWYLNNDTVVAPDSLERLLHRMDEDPDIGICGATLVGYAQPDVVQAYGGTRYSYVTGRGWACGAGEPLNRATPNARAEAAINYVSGASMFVRLDKVMAAGPMCEEYFLYNEEIDWAYRGRGRFKLAVETSALVRHKEGATIGTEARKGSASPLATFYQTRSKLLFALRNTPQFLPTVWLALLVRCARLFLRGERENAVVGLQALMGRRTPAPEWSRVRAKTAQEGRWDA